MLWNPTIKMKWNTWISDDDACKDNNAGCSDVSLRWTPDLQRQYPCHRDHEHIYTEAVGPCAPRRFWTPTCRCLAGLAFHYTTVVTGDYLLWVELCSAVLTYNMLFLLLGWNTDRQVKKTVPAVDNWLTPEGVRRQGTSICTRLSMCVYVCVCLSCCGYVLLFLTAVKRIAVVVAIVVLFNVKQHNFMFFVRAFDPLYISSSHCSCLTCKIVCISTQWTSSEFCYY